MGGCLEVESKHPAGTQLYRLGFVWCAAVPIQNSLVQDAAQAPYCAGAEAARGAP